MTKEEILSKNKKDNLFFDEYDKQRKLKGQSFGLLFTTIICAIIIAFKIYANENTSDIVTILWASLFSVMAYKAYYEKNKTNIIISIFCFIFMVYYFIKFIMVVV